MTPPPPHLLFLPRDEGGPALFLWPKESATAFPDLADGAAPITVQVLAETGDVRRTRGLRLPLVPSIERLARMTAGELARVPASMLAWSLAAKLALELVGRERLVPMLVRGARGTEARWGVSLSAAADAERCRVIAAALPLAARAVVPAAARSGRDGPLPAVPAASLALGQFLDAAADAIVRSADTDGAFAEGGASSRPRAGRDASASWESRFVAALTTSDPAAGIDHDGILYRNLHDELAEWIAPLRGHLASRTARVCLKLDPPAPDDGVPDDDRWRLRYFLQAVDDPSLLLPAAQVWRARGTHLTWMDRRFVEPQELLLRELARAGRTFPPIDETLDTAHPESVALDDDGAWQFLSEAAPLLGEAGFTVLLPAALASDRSQMRLRMRIGGASRGVPGAVESPARLSLDSLLAFRWDVSVGDVTLSAKEFETLVALKRPLVRWRGQWILLDPRQIATAQRLLHGGRPGTMHAVDAIAAGLTEQAPVADAGTPIDVVAEGPLASMLAALRDELPAITVPADLDATLRPYQTRGLSWMALMATLSLGGCLADDMGLGKTIQTIAFLLARRAAHSADGRLVLVVCPTSVVGNWERELARFAPSLPVLLHHGAARGTRALRETPPHTVVITTYSLLRRDREALTLTDWAAVVLDEAQNIKNVAARQTQAARALRATHRFALTGTPVENRLAELWSILDYCVPGLLGPLERFRRRFAVPIERYRDERAAGELRRLIGPFVLRRLKSDPAIVADLPPKQEITTICTLTREQATLYQAAVSEAMDKIARVAGIERKGLVLALLTALKQICNHPAQYLRDDGPLPRRSGKLERLTEMLDETIASGDPTLVFTQFREMGERLVPHLRGALGTEVLFLHGGVPRRDRDAMVQRFQAAAGPRIFVLSLKAGGTGLNLTRATRVFHFDRWWNPAVEDQATDRAHRIGQRHAVQVFRLVTAGTVEEKIDTMLADKRALATRVVGGGETWITELSDDELETLVRLGSDAVVDDERIPARRRG